LRLQQLRVQQYARHQRNKPQEFLAMSTLTPSRSAWNHGLIDDYRANGRPTSGPFVGRQVLLLTTRGARSGEDRTSPLAWTRDGDRIVVVASMGGAPTHPHWYTNLRAHPIVTVELNGETFPARATIVDDPAERRRLYDQHAELHPSFTEYERKTTREIPVIALERLPSEG
jgi:deazaflavin-dependent oxidoreductase (nitroreductase family)